MPIVFLKNSHLYIVINPEIKQVMLGIIFFSVWSNPLSTKGNFEGSYCMQYRGLSELCLSSVTLIMYLLSVTENRKSFFTRKYVQRVLLTCKVIHI